MKTIAAWVVAVLGFGFLGSMGVLWYQTAVRGGLLQSSDMFMTVVLALVPVALIAGAIFLIKGVSGLLKSQAWALIGLVGLVGLSGCNYAHSNVQTLVTHDCGVSWQLIKPGSAVPRGVGNYCFRAITIPDYPMDGNSEFKSNFKNNVKATIDLDYSYRITDAVAFIGEAKYVGKQADTEDAKANDTKFETAENVVIDKRIRDVSRDLLLKYDIVDFSPADFEDELKPKVNEALAPLGIQIDFLSFVPLPDVQTAQAIDAVSAQRIFQANGLQEFGLEIMKSRAGATQVIVGQQPKPEEKK